MFKKLLLFVFSLYSLFCFSQQTTEARTYFNKAYGFIHTNKDSCYFYFNKSINLADKTDDIGTLLYAYSYLIYANGVYYDLKKYKENLDKMGLFLGHEPRMENFRHREHYKRRYLYINGNYHFKMGNYTLSEMYFLKLYALLQNLPSEKMYQMVGQLQGVQNFLAAIYLKMGKTSLAEQYYHKNIELANQFSQNGELDEEEKWTNYMSLGLLYQNQKDFRQAANFFNKALQGYKNKLNDPAFRNILISIHQVLAKNHLLQKKPDSALVVLKFLSQKKLLNPENLRFVINQNQYKARAFAQKEDFEIALEFYQKALENALEYRNTPNHPDVAEIYSEMAELFAGGGKFEKSLLYFQKALSSLSKGFDSKKVSENPDPSTTFSKLTLVSVLRDKAEVLSMAYNSSSNLEYLEAGNKTGKAIVQTLDALKPEFESKVDFQFLLEEVFPAFDRMINTAWLLYHKTGEQNYLKDAFFFSEKSRAVFLLSAVQKTHATEFSGVPDHIISQEQVFKSKISHLEKEVFKNPGDKKSQTFLFDLKNDYRFFLKEIETQYPAYHKLKFASKVAGLSEIQDLLEENQVLLDYYLTENRLFIFSIEKEKTKFERLELTGDFSDKINALREGFSKPDHTNREKLKNLNASIFHKIIPGLNKNTSELIVLRHGVLNYIPFGALYDPSKEEYLIEKYAISYANSASLYKEHIRKKILATPKILAFAPDFSAKAQVQSRERDNSATFGDLLYNKKEVRLIGSYFDADILLDKAASLSAFKTKAEDYGILHFATHARINGNFPDYSCLAFSPADSTNLLYIKDLYSYKLNSELVVLSACETGTGKLQKGAGMLSIARGFNYAGAHSLLTTQWKIDDKSTSVLMESFYKNLAKGQPKNIALRNAKLDYLKTTDDAMLRHPYYWAGFVLTGNTSPIVAESEAWVWWIVGGGVILGLLVFFFWKKDR